MPLLELRLDDAYRAREGFAQGGDLVQDFVRFIFPINGRERRTMFLPVTYWGKKKPQYKKFDWNYFETRYFDSYTYPEGKESLGHVINYLEDDHEKNNRIFGVENRFTKKIPVILYQSRRDFEQTNIIAGPVPESLGGLTELFSWKRVIFPFQGNLQELEHVTKHEGTHIYQIAKGVRRLPLWFIEGSAETNSIYWDAQAELIIRDSFVNGFFFRVSDLWQVQGTFLMYKQGNFITNVIWDEYGEKGFRKIYDRANSLSFGDNIKKSLGLTIEELDQKVSSALASKFSGLLNRKDLSHQAKTLKKGSSLLAGRNRFFISGERKGPRLALILNYVREDGKLERETLVADRKFSSSSLDFFRRGAFLGKQSLAYVIKQSRQDALRVRTYSWNEKKEAITLGSEQEFKWPEFETLADPVVLGKTQLAFIGYQKGYPNIYLYDSEKDELRQLTNAKRHISGLDYSSVRGDLVYSQEDRSLQGEIRHDRNLYLLNVDSGVTRRLTRTLEVNETRPRFSPDGKTLLFVGDSEGTYDLFFYDLAHEEYRRLTQMQVGATRPQWGPKGTLYFNGYKFLTPNVYQAKWPTAGELLAMELPKHKSQMVDVGKEGLLLRAEPKSSSSEDKVERELNLHEAELIEEGDGALAISEKATEYSVRSAARLRSAVLFKVKRGSKGDKTVYADDRPRFYLDSGLSLQNLSSDMVARRSSDKELVSAIEKHLKNRPVVAVYRAAHLGQMMVLVNNRLAKQKDLFEDQEDIGVLILNKNFEAVHEFKDAGPLGEIDSEKLQWVSFLANGSIFTAIGEESAGPFILGLLDPKSSKYKEIAYDARSFRVSQDRKFVAWYQRGRLKSYDAKTKAIGKVEGIRFSKRAGLAYDFVPSGQLIVSQVNLEEWKRHSIDLGQGIQSETIRRLQNGGRILQVAISRSNGDVAILYQKREKQTLWLWKKSTFIKEIQESGFNVRRIYFYRDILMAEGRDLVRSEETRVFRDGGWAGLKPFVSGKILSDRLLLVETTKDLFLLERSEVPKTWEIAEETRGYALDGDRLVFSALDYSRFQLFSYQLSTGVSAPLTASDTHQIQPIIVGKDLVWSSREGETWILRQAPLKNLQDQSEIRLDGYDLLFPSKGEEGIESKAFLKSDEGKKDSKQIEESVPQRLLGGPASAPFRLQSLAAAAAFDGSNFRFLVSGFADNLFSDRGIFVNGVFLGDTRYATGGFTDLKNGYSYSAFFNSRDEIRNSGAQVTKRFLLDRYREINLFSIFEVQDYGEATPETANFVTPGIEGNTFYLFKPGALFVYDVTIWDRHGPISGSRFFFRMEVGLDAGNQALANYDANLDWRIYHQLLPRFGFAHRLVAGTSQGDLENIFLLGGNPSFRGLGFDDLEGQNYWVFSEDLRVPIFDFLGAKFFDPVDAFLGFFTRYFDVRGGIYADVGGAWFNNGDYDTKYSIGYFVNVPTLLGINLRFSHGFAGEKGFNFWLGVNW